jgi:hypothetical protein
MSFSRWVVLVAALLVTFNFCLWAANAEPDKNGGSTPIKPPTVESGATRTNKTQVFKGELRAGVLAIGAESTGFLLKTDENRFELSPKASDEKVQKQMTEMSGKRVAVTGQLTVRKGVERPVRKIIVVESVRAAE